MSTKSTSRRRFLRIAGAASAHAALYAQATPATPPRAGAQSLAGQWRFSLDRDDAGAKSAWFASELGGGTQIRLPGILQTQGFGDEITAETQFVAALPRDMRWYLLPQYQAYTKPGHVEVPYLSQPVRHYLGVAWYQREIEIPAAWNGKRIALTLERTRWQTDVYLDDKLMGSNRSLVAPHEFELGLLSPGRHRLSIRIDNRMLPPPYRPDGHSVSDALGSTWNGMVGRIELSATSPVWIDDAQVFPNVANRSTRIRVKVGNIGGLPGAGTLRAGSISAPVNWTAEGGEATLDVPLPNAAPWSEFQPVLQHLAVSLSGPNADDRRDLTFGLREIKADGKNILLNGELFHFRATHDGGAFPLTGYPATDVATWKRIIGICKDWGLNGIRFHSWCPPEAAFTAADEIGFYLRPECGMWNSFDAERKMLGVLNDETAALLKAYGNHPSLVMLGASNEPAGHYPEQLPEWDRKWREADPRRLYTDGTGRFAPAPGGPGTPFAADFLVTPTARGPRGWFGADYEETLKGLLRGSIAPCIGHEVGQWCAYPDFAVIEKFSGKAKYAAFPEGIGTGKAPYMHPGNYIIMRDSAEKHGILARNREIAHASGRFQAACYKEEIEASLRTPSYSGYELLDLHDYLGQGGALIGLVDAFWESKGYVTPEEVRQFNNTTVPLARLRDRVMTNEKPLHVEVELAHFGPKPLPSVTPVWRIVDGTGKTAVSGALPQRAVPRGKNLPLGVIDADLAKLRAPAGYRLVVELQGTPFRNEWSFWLYPAKLEAPVPRGVAMTESWAEAKAALASGGRVLFLSGAPEKPSAEVAMTTAPIFWNRLMNPNRTWMLGLWCNQKHPALAGFPTEANCDWQWVDLLGRTSAMNIDSLPKALEPIVQPIDDWNRNLRFALLFECAVGQGRLMVTSLNLPESEAAKHAGGPSLRKSILDYMASPQFKPGTELTMAALDAWMPVRYTAPAPVLTPPNSPDVADPGQVKKGRGD
ncbi:MAG TPA: glycoside hydrolase [Verrucomicrobiae bacterium]|nr:glycoside hydrolase [Verrucomicrobiae bacterium]